MEELIVSGTVKGKIIELDQTLGLPEGTRVQVYLKTHEEGAEGLIRLFADEPDLLDTLVEQAMRSRETTPLRMENGQSATGLQQ